MKFTKKNAIGVAIIIAVVSFWAAFAQKASAATANISVGSTLDKFTPDSVTISPNDSVVWTWAATFHSSTSGTNGVHGDDNGVPSGSWDSGIISTLPKTFTNVFTSVGVFNFYCSVHFSIGMTGQVFVVGSSTPPSLAITNPLNGAIFAEPANVNIQAAVTNGTAPVTSVKFFSGTTLLATENTGPFSTTANNLSTGNYTFSVVAQDGNGLLATNAVNISVVTPVDVTLTNSTISSGTNFQFSYGANVGLNYVIQRATVLAPPNWVPIATNIAASNPTNYTDIHATSNPAFYRVGRLPNP